MKDGLDRYVDREREIDRYIDRQRIDRQRASQIEGYSDGLDRQIIYRQIVKLRDTETDQIGRQIDRQIYRQIYRQFN